MQAKKQAQEGLLYTFNCTVPAADIEKAVGSELQRLGKNVKIAGFRPGHVPTKILQQRYGKSVEADVLRNLITEGVTKTITENKLRPALSPQLEEQKHEEGKDLSFTFKVEVLPEVPEMKFDGITVTRQTFEVTDADVEDALGRLAARSPRPSALPESTKAAKGHVVTMDFVGKRDGVAFEGGTAQGYDVELGLNSLIAGFEDQLEGMKAGDEKQIVVTFPEAYFNQELAGKDATFDITLHKVSELKTPEINEEFAKSAGFGDLRALKEAVRDQLVKEFNSMVRTNMKRELFDMLEEKVDFPIPEGMLKLEFDSIWQKLKQAQAEGDESLKGKNEDELKEEYTAIAARRVRLGILLAEIGRKEKLNVTREELSRALLQYAGNFPGQEQKVLEYYKANPERLDEFRGPILEEKAVDFILSKVKYQDKPTAVKDFMDAGEQEAAETKPTKKSPAKKTAAKPAKKSSKKE